MNKKKLLLIGRLDSTYIQQLGKHLKEYLDVYLFDITNFIFLKFEDNNKVIFEIKAKKSKFLHILFFQRIKIAKNIIDFIKNDYKYGFVHYQYVKYEYLFLYKQINNLGKKVFVTVWGSDFHSNPIKFLFKKFYKKANSICFAKESMKNDFIEYFKLKSNYKLIDMGLEQLDYIERITSKDLEEFKELVNYQKEEIIITVGSSASKNENQISILNILLNNKELLNKFKIHIILPLTYGGNVSNELNKKINDISCDFKITKLEYFLSYETLAALRLSTDIYINNRNNDQFAAAMIEHFYAGSVVMHGSWLDYPLNEMGVHYYKYSNENEFIEKLSYILKNIEQEKKLNIANKNIFNNLYKWDNIIHKWIELYKD